MEYDADENQSVSTMATVRLDNTGNLTSCQVCGHPAARKHYGGLCCVSCKMFFRRNYQFDLTAHQCVFRHGCEISSQNRRACRYCRLRKCLSIGMRRELLRDSHPTTHLITPHFSDRYHRAILDNRKWLHLKHIVQSYDTESPVARIRHLSAMHVRDPLKIRWKMSRHYLLDIMCLIYRSLFSFISTLPEYQSIPLDDKSLLMQRNFINISHFHGIILYRDADLLSNPIVSSSLSTLYGSDFADSTIRIIQRTEQDGTINRLFIPILLFSTAFNVAYPEDFHKDHESFDVFFAGTRRLFYLQNLYLDMMFKYLIHRFGYSAASLRFASLVKTILDQSNSFSQTSQGEIHEQLMRTILDEIGPSQNRAAFHLSTK